jgi:metal-responsive CopG/Arc/MetJ family transcriptional regulator
MSTNMKRFMLSIDDEQAKKMDGLKKETFYNKSQAEMVRYLIELGLAAHQKTKEASNQ